MKMLILGIDALDPKMLFKNIDSFPNIKKLCSRGVSGAYDAYVYGYGSRDNWISLYTGLTPKQHGTIGNTFLKTGKRPVLSDFDDKLPFWDMLNSRGISTGIWKAIATTPPRKLKGYMVSGEPNLELDRSDDPTASIMPVFCSEDSELYQYICGEIGMPPMPRKLEDFGYTWEQFTGDPAIAESILTDDYFHEGVAYFKAQCDFYKNNIINMQKNNPVDVLFYYTDIIDFICHFQCHDEKYTEILKTFSILDEFVGDMIDSLSPETVILMSDHGIIPWAHYFPDTPIEIQKEAFGLRDTSIWLKNGQIVTRARNLSLLTSAHGLKGTFIAAGKGIKKAGGIGKMRTVDFYPTLLEFFDITVPEGRSGYVVDILDKKELVNKNILPDENKIEKEDIAIIQNCEVPEFNKIINEVFLEHRFARITIIGEEKYRNIFLGDGRVYGFKPFTEDKMDFEELAIYDRVLIYSRNLITLENKIIEIFKRNL